MDKKVFEMVMIFIGTLVSLIITTVCMVIATCAPQLIISFAIPWLVAQIWIILFIWAVLSEFPTKIKKRIKENKKKKLNNITKIY